GFAALPRPRPRRDSGGGARAGPVVSARRRTVRRTAGDVVELRWPLTRGDRGSARGLDVRAALRRGHRLHGRPAAGTSDADRPVEGPRPARRHQMMRRRRPQRSVRPPDQRGAGARTSRTVPRGAGGVGSGGRHRRAAAIVATCTAHHARRLSTAALIAAFTAASGTPPGAEQLPDEPTGPTKGRASLSAGSRRPSRARGELGPYHPARRR